MLAAERVDIVIAGAGQAGGWVARTLRESHFAGRIVLVGEEHWPPYERPSLSKGLLSGKDAAATYVITREELDAAGIEFRSGTRIESIDRPAREVVCTDGERLAYGRLVLATGGRARLPPIPGIDAPGVHVLRTLDDCHAIAGKLSAARRLVVVGGGWIGLEVAATARQLGIDVTVIEAGPRLCARSVPPSLSLFLLELHRTNAVAVRLSTAVTAIERLGDGTLNVMVPDAAVTADLVVVGAGLVPRTEIAEASGLDVLNGIVVDGQGRTSDPNIYAVGDVANRPCRWTSGRARFECWANAQNQAISVGRNLAGAAVNHDEIPWFWSDQYDCNIQLLGVPVDDAPDDVLRGSVAERRFTRFQLVDGLVTAVIAVNAARDLKIARRWMHERRAVPRTALADSMVRLDRIDR